MSNTKSYEPGFWSSRNAMAVRDTHTRIETEVGCRGRSLQRELNRRLERCLVVKAHHLFHDSPAPIHKEHRWEHAYSAVVQLHLRRQMSLIESHALGFQVIRSHRIGIWQIEHVIGIGADDHK